MTQLTMTMMRTETIDDTLTLRRKATSALIDMLCQTSPIQFAFRTEGRRHQKLTKELLAAKMSGDDATRINDELHACGEHLVKLADLIEWQWGAVIDARQRN